MKKFILFLVVGLVFTLAAPTMGFARHFHRFHRHHSAVFARPFVVTHPVVVARPFVLARPVVVTQPVVVTPPLFFPFFSFGFGFVIR